MSNNSFISGRIDKLTSGCPTNILLSSKDLIFYLERRSARMKIKYVFLWNIMIGSVLDLSGILPLVCCLTF